MAQPAKRQEEQAELAELRELLAEMDEDQLREFLAVARQAMAPANDPALLEPKDELPPELNAELQLLTRELVQAVLIRCQMIAPLAGLATGYAYALLARISKIGEEAYLEQARVAWAAIDASDQLRAVVTGMQETPESRA